MKYVEFCAGIGGMRAGLDAAGWECVLALDHDPDAVHVHRLAHGNATLADVTQLSPRDVPSADVWVAGFPCQPFSSSGTRQGFVHDSGNVFEHIVRLATDCRPRVLVLENVEGLLSNKSGHTFATILGELTRIGYEVDWLVLDLQCFDVPQSRPRLFMIAAARGVLQRGNLNEDPGALPGMGAVVPSVFARYLEEGGFSWAIRSRGEIGDVVERMRPAVGKARHVGPQIFGSLGHAKGDNYVAFDLGAPALIHKTGALAPVVAPEFSNPELIRSVRYYSRGKGTQAYLRREPISHCVGTSLGGAPLFAVPTSSIRRAQDREAFLRFSNWHREEDGLLVMRLRPERAVLLFGPYTAGLSAAVDEWPGGATRKFKLVGNMVAPVCAFEVAKIVRSHVFVSGVVRSSLASATRLKNRKAAQNDPVQTVVNPGGECVQ